MLFPTFTFAVFFVVVLVANWLLHRRFIAWKSFLLAASYVFYGYWDPRFVLLIMASTIGNWLIAGRLHESQDDERRRYLVIAALGLNLGILGYFKYAGFFGENLERFGLDVDANNWNIVLPVGISFFTFQALSYVLDVHRRELSPGGLLDFAVYLAFFPQLVAGPIVRASEFLPQLQRRLDPRNIDLTRAALLIGVGLFKKVVISSYMADAIVDDVFGVPERASAMEALIGIYAYAIQIYADFSGYSDIAIGVALLLGFQFPDNFNRPYGAATIGDFWRRWHMTLSRWLRDYLYISLGGNRLGERRRSINMFLTMLLGGLWHGAAWNFVFWGVLHGAGLGIEREFYERRGLKGPVIPVLGQLFTFHFVCLAWVFFRADFGQAINLLTRLVTGWSQPSELVTTWLVLTIAAALAVQIIPRDILANFAAGMTRIPMWGQASAFGVWLVVIDQLGPDGVAPFIYFQF